MKKNITLAISILGLFLVLVGCGTTTQPKVIKPNTTSTTSANQVLDPSQYQDIGKLESLAKANPNDAKAQMNAGISAYAYKDYTKAIGYYNNAIKINPKDGIAYNNIGNVYFRGLKKSKDALPFYEKATLVEPTYNYGWLNLALCQKDLGDTAGAKATIAQGLKVLATNDKLVEDLKNLQKQIK
ncbi:tetratricopeptide repeat protein [Desulfosporosinus sp. Sb-LF]|uniref:tetratricopeptide repeat protein n=1 Tax=Desulfosporosinus sp. Sb-LF TaxID=2560027 RepID=UPI00107FA0A8|nr:tetratricopeptide repeat protein [Desulfosporosinus sp. Sb-LF]TGE31962.1 tetratricopeptide repeat protein [Desulfosporosinus sp. Sb-LF]